MKLCLSTWPTDDLLATTAVKDDDAFQAVHAAARTSPRCSISWPMRVSERFKDPFGVIWMPSEASSGCSSLLLFWDTQSSISSFADVHILGWTFHWPTAWWHGHARCAPVTSRFHCPPKSGTMKLHPQGEELCLRSPELHLHMVPADISQVHTSPQRAWPLSQQSGQAWCPCHHHIVDRSSWGTQTHHLETGQSCRRWQTPSWALQWASEPHPCSHKSWCHRRATTWRVSLRVCPSTDFLWRTQLPSSSGRIPNSLTKPLQLTSGLVSSSWPCIDHSWSWFELAPPGSPSRRRLWHQGLQSAALL